MPPSVTFQDALLSPAMALDWLKGQTERLGAIPPADDTDARLDPWARVMLDNSLPCAVVGSADTVRKGLAAFIARTGADELMITAQIFDHTARRRSFEILAGVHGGLREAA